MGKSVIIFNGRRSIDYGIIVEHPPSYEIAERDYDIVRVPGRNGDLTFDQGSYSNVQRSYDIAVVSLTEKYTIMVNRIAEWIHSASGYARLEDTYEPEYFRIAQYKESTKVNNVLNRGGRATISFDCKPQRFLKMGEEPVKFDKLGYLENPTNFIALPEITVRGNGSGQFRVGHYTVIIDDIASYTTINSDLQDVYKDLANRNSHVTMDNGFPKLHPGTTEISFSGGITSLEVIPKWWTL